MASPPPPPTQSTMENLPSDILSNIFLRLFAKQLAQMRSLSKSWNSLLSKPSFIKSHLQRSIKNDKILLVSFQGFSFTSKAFTAHPSRSPRMNLTGFIKLPVSPQPEDTRGRVIGAVNGLICFFAERSIYSFLHIWNPSLNAMLSLPPIIMLSPFLLLPLHIFTRFGYDPKSDDYKVVKISCSLRKPPVDHVAASFSGTLSTVVREWLPIEIYSMRNGMWDLIKQKFPSHITWVEDQDEVYVDGYDGHLHFLCYSDLKGKRQVIVAFDLGNEILREMPLPDALLDFKTTRLNVLGRLGGKLCVMSTIVDNGCEVSVMNEYGVSESWVKYCVFSNLGNIVPYGFTSNIELCFQDQSGRLALYDSVAAKTKKFRLSDKEHHIFKIIEYVDSLVWVAPAKREISCDITNLQINE